MLFSGFSTSPCSWEFPEARHLFVVGSDQVRQAPRDWNLCWENERRSQSHGLSFWKPLSHVVIPKCVLGPRILLFICGLRFLHWGFFLQHQLCPFHIFLSWRRFGNKGQWGSVVTMRVTADGQSSLVEFRSLGMTTRLDHEVQPLTFASALTGLMYSVPKWLTMW